MITVASGALDPCADDTTNTKNTQTIVSFSKFSNVSNGSNGSNTSNTGNGHVVPPVAVSDPLCDALVAATSVYIAAGIVDGREPKKIAECKKGRVSRCSCQFEVYETGYIALMDDVSMIDTAPGPPIPPVLPPVIFAFDAPFVPIFPNWTWYPSIPPLPPKPPYDFWKATSDWVKYGIPTILLIGGIIYGIYRYWWWTHIGKPLGPYGAEIKLGNMPKAHYEMVQEKVHAYMNPEEVHMSAQRALQKEQEMREEARKRAAENAFQAGIKARSRPLMRAGPEPEPERGVIPIPAHPSYLLEMYKPLDKDRVFQTTTQQEDS